MLEEFPSPSVSVRRDGDSNEASMTVAEMRSEDPLAAVPAKFGRRLASCVATVDHHGFVIELVRPYPDGDEPQMNITCTCLVIPRDDDDDNDVVVVVSSFVCPCCCL